MLIVVPPQAGRDARSPVDQLVGLAVLAAASGGQCRLKQQRPTHRPLPVIAPTPVIKRFGGSLISNSPANLLITGVG
ncbi:immunoglobulin lambda light chain variable region [Micromonospora saelicesensis]|uniref:immunoglobulin lambda light chain variable region n=1 Tax=Micromonospora saelicesensis TaxID=285676 RepID=UPI0021ACD128|nr:immunoglobulin lambda light chain variable region [Micromonospora saelicesensis]